MVRLVLGQQRMGIESRDSANGGELSLPTDKGPPSCFSHWSRSPTSGSCSRFPIEPILSTRKIRNKLMDLVADRAHTSWTIPESGSCARCKRGFVAIEGDGVPVSVFSLCCDVCRDTRPRRIAVAVNKSLTRVQTCDHHRKR